MPCNAFGQAVGDPLAGWTPPSPPPREPIAGRYCRLEPLDARRHAADLFAAYAAAPDARDWTYLPLERPSDVDGLRALIAAQSLSRDPLHFAVLDGEGHAVGSAALMRIDPQNGVLEVGHINFSPRLKQTRAGTEAIVLFMRLAFRLGYRRFEWKCDSLNAPSRRAAERYGFVFEGVFRQAVVTKGRNRDTAWYAILDRDWPRLESAFDAWLAPENFDAAGRQRRPLAARAETPL